MPTQRPTQGLYQEGSNRILLAVGVAFLFGVAPKLAATLLAYGLMAAVAALFLMVVLNGLN